MKTSSILLGPLLLAAGAIAQEVLGNSCSGEGTDTYVTNNVGYCCQGGEFSGPVISSFSASQSTLQASISDRQSSQQSSFSDRESSREASISSRFSNGGINTGAAAQVTPAAKLRRGELVGRAITTEATSGLTCIGDAFSTFDAGGVTDGTSTSSAGSGSPTSTSTSTGGVPMITPGPVLAMGAAAAFAYAAM